MTERWVCLDVGETLIDETRVWSLWADIYGIPRLTFFAALGAAIARGEQPGDVFGTFDITEKDWRARLPELEDAYGGFQDVDLYPDARRALDRLRGDGYRLAVLANQPARRTAELKALGIQADVIAMSDELQIWKPDPAFFARGLKLLGSPPAADVAYVGDRVDNDVLPTIAAGMRAVWIRRGPWGVIQSLPPETPALVVATLDELTDRMAEAFA
ncbi:MAG TPA: HAD family hydrolase [Candidatus Binatia bacterium]|nr:HAD family hydrolase [Candidatus Binatia bacterium]